MIMRDGPSGPASRRSRHSLSVAVVAAAGALSLAGVLSGCATTASAQVARTGSGMISSTVSVPAGYETIYLSGMTGTLQPPQGSAPGTPPPDSGDTEAQALRALEKIQQALAEQHLTMGDVVMMHAYLAPDPATGRGDSKGWTAAYTKYFGTPEQPNKPSRTSITVVLGSPVAKIEIETIAVRKPPKQSSLRTHRSFLSTLYSFAVMNDSATGDARA
jgi:enamine deaminase RidA (YjgF/YER057c/UK114 family)